MDWETFKFRPTKKYVVQDNGCWLWLGHVTRPNKGSNSFGYGIQRTFVADGQRLGRKLPAHKVVYEVHKGEVPDGLDLDHTCRVRHCVNPDHLEPVTRRENVLRGEGLAAINANKTHCKRGHEFSGDNLLENINPKNCQPRRACRTCNKIRMRKHLDKKKGKVM